MPDFPLRGSHTKADAWLTHALILRIFLRITNRFFYYLSQHHWDITGARHISREIFEPLHDAMTSHVFKWKCLCRSM
jgi:hypothetical protein